MPFSEEYLEAAMEDEMEVMRHSRSYLTNASELVQILYDYEDPTTHSPCTEINVYFGENEDHNSKYVLRLVHPFDAAGLIVLINKTLGGDLYAKECRTASCEELFINQCIDEFITSRFTERTDGMFYMDYGWFEYEKEINKISTYEYSEEEELL